MKNTFVIISSILLFNLVACKSKAKAEATAQPTTQPTVYKGVTNDSCAVEVSFGSMGGGIDGKAFDAVIAKIDEKKLKYSSKAVGREGETRICLPLTEIKGKEKSEFIDQLKKIVAGAQLTSISIR